MRFPIFEKIREQGNCRGISCCACTMESKNTSHFGYCTNIEGINISNINVFDNGIEAIKYWEKQLNLTTGSETPTQDTYVDREAYKNELARKIGYGIKQPVECDFKTDGDKR